MIYECDRCEAALPPGVRSCPRCGMQFDNPVPPDAEVDGNEPPAPAFAQTASAEDNPFAAPATEPAMEPAAEPAPTPAAAKRWGIAVAAVLVGLVLVVGPLLLHRITTSTPGPTPVGTVTPHGPFSGGPGSIPVRPAVPAGALNADDRAYMTMLHNHSTRVAQCVNRFTTLCGQTNFDDLHWKAAMRANLTQMKHLAREGQTIETPGRFIDVQDQYNKGMEDYAYVADNMPSAIARQDAQAFLIAVRRLNHGWSCLKQAQTRLQQIAKTRLPVSVEGGQ